jgi:N-acetyl-gamma-glutamyl-phosphate reductase
MNSIKISIIGVSGYTGLEMLRLLLQHPHVQIHSLMGYSTAGKNIIDLYPHLTGMCNLEIETIDYNKAAQADIVFLCLPHMASQKIIKDLIGKTKIIDLSADFRLQDDIMFEKYYKQTHTCSYLTEQFVYGLPELYRDDIKQASNIANPGCFATNAQIALFPIKKYIESVSIVAITGSSGSGKTASAGTHHPVRDKNMKSYQIGSHRHIPEILQSCDIAEEMITFVPTSGPFVRGIHMTSTITKNTKISFETIKQLYLTHYTQHPFVRIKETIQLVEVIGSNYTDISIHQVNDKIVVQSVLDNLIKGASGGAIQNMNLMCGLEETTGLQTIPIFI